MKRLIGVVVCAFALCLTACSSTPKLAVPKLALVQVAMTSPDIFNQQFMVRLSVENPNDQELPITGVDYKLFLEGDGFAEGLSNKPLTVPAKGDADFDMIVTTHFVSSTGRLVSRLNGRDQVQYVFEGKLLTSISGMKSIPFQETGSAAFKVKK